jgi:hypothetical protein
MKHRKPNRLKGYDYSHDNLYFVTSCVHDMICCFGDVVVGTGRDLSLHEGVELQLTYNSDIGINNTRTGHDLPLREPQMILNGHGEIAEKQWY